MASHRSLVGELRMRPGRHGAMLVERGGVSCELELVLWLSSAPPDRRGTGTGSVHGPRSGGWRSRPPRRMSFCCSSSSGAIRPTGSLTPSGPIRTSSLQGSPSPRPRSAAPLPPWSRRSGLATTRPGIGRIAHGAPERHCWCSGHATMRPAEPERALGLGLLVLHGAHDDDHEGREEREHHEALHGSIIAQGRTSLRR